MIFHIRLIADHDGIVAPNHLILANLRRQFAKSVDAVVKRRHARLEQFAVSVHRILEIAYSGVSGQ